MPKSRQGKGESAGVLHGWKEIATFLGLPVSTAQRWAKSGMPVRREGRRVEALPDQLNVWMGREASEPVHIATESADLSSELRRGLSYIRKKQAHGKEAA